MKHQGNPLATTRHWVAIYRERGYQPLPSDRSDKKPLCEFADYWERPFDRDPFESAISSNVQVMTGRHWRLLVIDLDGEDSFGEWATWGRCPKTWTVLSGSGEGRHLWFRLPTGIAPLPKAFLWFSKKRHAIERLCDCSLAMAPPSVHPRTGQLYKWASRLESPLGMNQPAMLPDWILKREPVPGPNAPKRSSSRAVAWRPSGPLRVSNIPALVASWGVRVAGQPSSKGWLPVHAIGREDRHPSAAIHCETGRYVDQGSGTRMSLIDLALTLGVYADWREAIKELKAR